MESIRNALSAKSTLDGDNKYEPLASNVQNAPQIMLSKPRFHRMSFAIKIFGILGLLSLWTALVAFYVSRHQHLLHWLSGSRNLIDQYNRFVDTDPFDSPFWQPYQGKSDRIDVSGWNYYGNDWLWLPKGSPYAIPGGRPLIPMYERDAWMKDYLGYISAYQHEIHCLGIIKHILNAYRDGKNVTAKENEHANAHCLEVIRHAVMCHPDLTLAVPEHDANGEEKEPFWGGEKHMCRDQKQVHKFLAERNMGFKWVEDEGGEKVIKAWAWPLPENIEGW
ncbi:hypothetical protein DM02DRAFT_654920 [Periconia macrospinosa]|uniref:Uncharacterized protein n=1 Tax=Periconia macrospinosa TaxID=97972 RepID=A0A2V1DW22_9PLEO|nr:hypothetical protein DM02DRAFT_654920 [Periconia macrospinosa]